MAEVETDNLRRRSSPVSTSIWLFIGKMLRCKLLNVRKRPEPLVRRRGLEPLRFLQRQDLNLVRLPISPPSPDAKADSTRALETPHRNGA